MATTKFKGQPVKIIGEFIKVGTVAPDFELVKTDLSSFFLKDLKGKKFGYQCLCNICAQVQQAGSESARYSGFGDFQRFAFCPCTVLYYGRY